MREGGGIPVDCAQSNFSSCILNFQFIFLDVCMIMMCFSPHNFYFPVQPHLTPALRTCASTEHRVCAVDSLPMSVSVLMASLEISANMVSVIYFCNIIE